MKMRMLILIGVLGCAAWLPGQVQPELGPGNVGFVTVLNAVSTAAPTRITVGPVAMNGGGEVRGGESTGSLGLFAGDYMLEVNNPACDPPSYRKAFTVVGGTTLALVVYTDLKKKDDKLIPVMNSASFSQGAENAAVKLSLLSLSSQPEVPVKVGQEVVPLRPKTPRGVDVKPDQIVTYQLPGQEEPGTIELGADGHFILFVFDDAQAGKFGSGVLAHVKVELDLPAPER